MRQSIIAACLLLSGVCVLVGGAEPIQTAGKNRIIETKAKDFRLVSDRAESVADFFKRNRVMLGGLPFEGGNENGDLQAVLAAKVELPEVSLHHASPNDDLDSQLRFITQVRVVPPTPEVAKLLGEFKKADATNFVLILTRDKAGSNTYRPVGYTTHTPVGFFTKQSSGSVDGIAAKDLLFEPAEK